MFDQEKADRAVNFVKQLTHTQGDWARQPFNILPWEEKIIRDLFGTVNEDGTRQYREAYISTGRKNGKTELAAALAILCLYTDGENGAEIYANAGDRDQAAKVFEAARTMVDQNQTLSNVSKILASVHRIIYPKRNSYFRVLSHEAETKHGFNVHVAINDEVHVWPNRKLYTAMKTGIGARKQPLIINITTAGFDKHSLCWDLYDRAKKIISGVVNDPTFYPAIFELDEGDDWKDEKNWYKANPGLGIYRELKEMRDFFKTACEVPSMENEFKRLYLNSWTEQETRWIPVERWDACDGRLDVEALRGLLCYGGLDLSSTTDLTAFVLCFPLGESFAFIPYFFIPQDTIRQRSERDRVPYAEWARQGHVIPTPGNVVDYEFVKAKIREVTKTYNLAEIAYDRWGATQISIQLQEDGVLVVPMGQGFASMSGPTKELEKLILGGRVIHGDNPVLRWMISNVVVKQDPAGNLKLDKGKSSDRIDGVVGMVMALDRAVRNEHVSPYSQRGVIAI